MRYWSIIRACLLAFTCGIALLVMCFAEADADTSTDESTSDTFNPDASVVAEPTDLTDLAAPTRRTTTQRVMPPTPPEIPMLVSSSLFSDLADVQCDAATARAFDVPLGQINERRSRATRNALKVELLTLLVPVFGDSTNDSVAAAARLVDGESGCFAAALSPTGDYGLFQINRATWGKSHRVDLLLSNGCEIARDDLTRFFVDDDLWANPAINAAFARCIYDQRGSWAPWCPHPDWGNEGHSTWQQLSDAGRYTEARTWYLVRAERHQQGICSSASYGGRPVPPPADASAEPTPDVNASDQTLPTNTETSTSDSQTTDTSEADAQPSSDVDVSTDETPHDDGRV